MIKKDTSSPRKGQYSLEKVVINLVHTKYPLLETIAKKEFNFKVSKNESDNKWDIYWSDTVSDYFSSF